MSAPLCDCRAQNQGFLRREIEGSRCQEFELEAEEIGGA
jgi:hypothetical protein